MASVYASSISAGETFFTPKELSDENEKLKVSPGFEDAGSCGGDSQSLKLVGGGLMSSYKVLSERHIAQRRNRERTSMSRTGP
jgi:hypothetical protein